MSSAEESPSSWTESAQRYLCSLALRVRTLLVSWFPQLTTIAVGLGALPIIVMFSCIAGWIVYTSTPSEWSRPLYFQFGDGLSPYAEQDIRSLSVDQPYDISLRLVVPATEQNYALGNFMASLTLRTPRNATVLSARRPVLVHEPFAFLPSIFGRPRNCKLDIVMAESLVTGAKELQARVELGRSDGWKSLGTGQGREISIRSARIEGIVRPEGIRLLVSMFPLTAGIAASVVFFSVSCTVFAAFLLPSALRSMPHSVVKDVVKREDDDDYMIRREPLTSLRTRRRSSHSTHEDIKAEETQ